MISVQTPRGSRLGLGTQPSYKAPTERRVQYVKTQWLTSVEWDYPLDNDPKLATGQPNSSLKNQLLQVRLKLKSNFLIGKVKPIIDYLEFQISNN